MSIFKEYIAYTKDNPGGHWFKRKLYGWGWVPVTWQGWAVTFIFVALIIINAIRFNPEIHTEKEVLMKFIPQTVVLILILIGICYLKGEKPRWQWGFPKKEEEHDPFI